MARNQQDGPPWGNSVDPDEAYVRGQAGSAGSGLAGGVGQAWYGGGVDAPYGPQAEVRRKITELARERVTPEPEPEPELDLDSDED